MGTLRKLSVEYRAIETLSANPRNPRRHSRKQIHQIAASMRRFGWTNPILLDAGGRIVAGSGRVEAAKLLGLSEVPTIRIEGLSDAELRAYVIADNRLAELAGWDDDLLAIEIAELSVLDLDFDLEITGFETAEIDLLIDGRAHANKAGGEVETNEASRDWERHAAEHDHTNEQQSRNRAFPKNNAERM
jgi:ParB-like chromosome segregation protein Spo0J